MEWAYAYSFYWFSEPHSTGTGILTSLVPALPEWNSGYDPWVKHRRSFVPMPGGDLNTVRSSYEHLGYENDQSHSAFLLSRFVCKIYAICPNCADLERLSRILGN